MKKPHHVCILGCGRSGTSIFGELFQSLPAYQYFSEPDLEKVGQFDFDIPVAIKVPRPSESTFTTPGLPFRLESFLRILPEPRILFWQVRHPLDTICSLRVGISKNWGHHPRPHDWRDWWSRPLIEQCAHHWNYLNTIGYQHIKSMVLINKFEDMILDPLGNALRCVRSAGLDAVSLLSYIKPWASRVQNENNENFLEAECSKPYSRNDHVRKVGRWQENLLEEELKAVLPIVAEGAREFGYHLPSP